MLLPNLRSSSSRSSAAMRSTSRRRRHRFAPDLLTLEARALLSTLTVMNDNDSGSGSLRYELGVAQPGDIIAFSPKAYGTITLTSGPLSVATGVDIQGPGRSKVAVSGGGKSTDFVVEQGVTATISGLKITGGSFANGFGGGGITNYGTLTLANALVTGNTVASGSYGAGGIFNAGTLTIAGSSISNNSGDFGSGINNNGPLTISDSSISDNSPTPNGGGAAIFSFADTTLTDCVVSGNTDGGISIAGSGYGPSATISTLTVSGSTIEDNSEDLNRGAALGAAIAASGANVTISNSLIADNTASSYLSLGGAIHMSGSFSPVSGANILTITGSTFVGNQAVSAYGPSSGGAIYTDPYATVSVIGSSFIDNTATSGDESTGGAMDLNGLTSGTITDCLFAGNQAVVPASSTQLSTTATGGAITNTGPSSPLTITGSTFAHNQALDGATAGFGIGGAIVNQFGATLTLSSSSLSGNSAIGGAAASSDPFGGFGIGGGLANQFNSGATVTRTSFLGNQAIGGAASQPGSQAGPGWGGAIANTIGATLRLAGSTVAANSAIGGAASDGATPGNGEGGGILNSGGSTLQVTGGVIIGNSAIGGAGGGSGQGGGVFNSGTGSNASLTGVLITLNSAIGGSGGGKGYGGGIYIGTGAITTLTNTVVLGNFASTAGNNIDGTYTGT